jgi:hypothetical protein
LPKEFEFNERSKWMSVKVTGKRDDDINPNKRSGPMRDIWERIEGKGAKDTQNKVPFSASRRAGLLMQVLELAVTELEEAKTNHDDHEKEYHSIRDGVLELISLAKSKGGTGEMTGPVQEDMDARRKKVELLAKAIETEQRKVDSVMS